MNLRIDPRAPDGRRSIENAIERLLALLDDMEVDPDLEDNDDAEIDTADEEPNLGWTEHLNQDIAMVVDEPGVEDGEPSLGFVGIATGYQNGETLDDREGDDEREPDDDLEDGADAEPFLGWSEAQSERGAQPTGEEFTSDLGEFYGTGQQIAKAQLARLGKRKPDWTKPEAYKPAKRILGDGRGLKDSDFDNLPWADD